MIEATIEVSGLRTRTLGTPGSADVLLLHGWGDSADCWRPVLGRLADEGVRGCAVDLPGYGRTDAVPGGPALDRLQVFVEALVARVDAPVVLAGYSLGGLLALRTAAVCHTRVAHVVAIAPPGLQGYWAQELARRMSFAARVALRVPAPAPRPLVRLLAASCYRAVSRTPGAIDGDIARRYAEHWRDSRQFRRQCVAMLDLLDEFRAPTTISRLPMPVTAMWGQRDPLVPAAAATALLHSQPHADIVLVQGAGHLLPVEAPTDVAAVLLAARHSDSSDAQDA